MEQSPLVVTGDNPDEIFDLIDLDDQVIGTVRRSDAHRDPSLVHRSVQVMVFDSSGRVLLQRRSATKDLFAGYFCASASGHVAAGEDYAVTAMRETHEELGQTFSLAYVGKELVRSAYETEMTALFLGRSDGPFAFHPVETAGGVFFALADLESYRPGSAVASTPLTPALMTALDVIFQLSRDGVLELLLPEI